MSKFTAAMDGNIQPARKPRVTLTENGALTNVSTFNAVLDFFAKSGALRNDTNAFLALFKAAYQENKLLAVRALFQARDVRGGNGERNNFRCALYWISLNDPETFSKIFRWVPHFGRWDDLWVAGLNTEIVELVRSTLKADGDAFQEGKSISLLAKWMPSENASSKATRQLAKEFQAKLKMRPKHYRQMLSALRAHLKVLERKMSANQWEDIKYEEVPSQAMKIHGRKDKAFPRHDSKRFGEYVKAVAGGEKKINAATLTPVQLVTQALNVEDPTIEALWNSLPNYMKDSSMLVVADTSGSMMGTPLCIAISLALYAAERNKGPFHNRWLNFSTRPSWQIVKGDTLHKKILNMDKHNWDGSTDIEAVFRLILKTASDHNLAVEDMPKIIVIISDMQFNPSSRGAFYTNLDTIKAQYRNAGYETPVLVWWNVRASYGQPATREDHGNILISGESPSAFKGLMECDADKLRGITPYDYTLEILNGERYGVIQL